VVYDFGIRLDDALTAGNYGQYGGGAFVNYTGAGVIASMFIHDGTPHPASSTTIHFVVTENVGAYFDVGADLTAQTQAQQGYATADASSTGLFSMQVLTSGGGYSSPGGLVFATSLDTMPEPGTIVPAALGGLLLLAAAWRKRPSPGI
jgi:hypothetical protein